MECSQESTIIGDEDTLFYDTEFEIEPDKTVEAIFQDGADNLNCEEFQLITDEGDTSNCVEELQLKPQEATSDLNHKYSFQSTIRVEEIFQDGAVNLNCEVFQLITDEFGLVGERATSNSDDEMQFEPNFNEKTLETNTHDTSNKGVTLGNVNAFCVLR